MSDFAAAQPGHLYLVGVGPGAPDLLTLRAVNILGGVDVVVAPRSSTSESSLALDIVSPHLRGQEIVEHVYPMARDQERTSRCWAQMADLCVERLQRGQSMAHITLGDPLIYSTCAVSAAGNRRTPRALQNTFHLRHLRHAGRRRSPQSHVAHSE